MRVTVCQWPDDVASIQRAWEMLVDHARAHSSEMVLLPEMPFSPWFARTREFDPDLWKAAVEAHDAWEARLPEIGSAAVLGTRPVEFGNERYNEGFVWEPELGMRAAHVKAYLPDEEGVWEASWYHAATPDFTPVEVGRASVGFLICTELWAMEQARLYGEEGVHFLVTPRLTGSTTREKWLAAGRVAAVIAGAFSLSSNRFDQAGTFGGQGWVIDPDGEVLALTTNDEPFVTVDADLSRPERARATYPRYVFAPRERREAAARSGRDSSLPLSVRGFD